MMEGRGGTTAAAGELEAAERLILRWDSAVAGEERMLFDGRDSSEAQRYLRAVNKICQAIKEQSITATGSPRRLLSASSSSLANAVQIAMARLEDEFHNILFSQVSEIDVESLTNLSSFSMSSSLDAKHSGVLSDRDGSSGDGAELSEPVELSESVLESEGSCMGTQSSSCCTMRSIRKIDLMPSDAISDLWSIAEGMILAGYGRECIQVYSSIRKSALDHCLRQLGVEKLSIGDVQRLEWDALESKIQRWIPAACVAIRIVFASERHLSDRIFNGLLPSNVDTTFTETIKGPALQLFSFAEAISIGHRSPKKLFKILDLHNALSNLLPDIAAIFCSKSSNSVYIQASEILSRLAEAVRGILSKFESAVLHDHSNTAVPGGTIHPLTQYVMNYISLIPGYKPALTNLILSCPRFFSVNDPIITPLELDIREDSNDQSPLASHLTWIIAILVQNLENKANLYKDAALSHLFMMNNVHYIVRKVKEESPDLREMIGDNYLRELTRKYQHEAMIYQRVTWMKILQCLRDKGLHMSGGSRGFSSGVSKLVLRERFRGFNAAFDEAHRIQSMWIVPDEQLREELRISILEKLLPAYRSFLGRFRQHIENGKHPKMYIKYSVEELESAISDFFEGHPPSLRKSSESHVIFFCIGRKFHWKCLAPHSVHPFVVAPRYSFVCCTANLLCLSVYVSCVFLAVLFHPQFHVISLPPRNASSFIRV